MFDMGFEPQVGIPAFFFFFFLCFWVFLFGGGGVFIDSLYRLCTVLFLLYFSLLEIAVLFFAQPCSACFIKLGRSLVACVCLCVYLTMLSSFVIMQIMRIIENIRPDRQTVLFSATFPKVRSPPSPSRPCKSLRFYFLIFLFWVCLFYVRSFSTGCISLCVPYIYPLLLLS